MTSLPWFRFYSEAINDRKIKRACMLSEQSKAAVIGVWLILLCFANESPKRGKLLISDDLWMTEEEILAETGLDMVAFGKIMMAFQKLNMVRVGTGYEIENWDKRQCASDNSTERVREWRKKKAKQDEMLQKRYSNAIDTDTDTDSDPNVDIAPNGANAHTNQPANQPEYIPEPIQELITALAGVSKTPHWPKTERDYTDAAYCLMGYNATANDIPGFSQWWQANGFYTGKPALKTILDEWKSYTGGVKRQPSKANGPMIPAPENERVGGLY